MQESIVFLVRVCHRKESSRSLSHLLMSFLYDLSHAICYSYGADNKRPEGNRNPCQLNDGYRSFRGFNALS